MYKYYENWKYSCIYENTRGLVLLETLIIMQTIDFFQKCFKFIVFSKCR